MGPPLDRRATLRRFAAPAAVACALFLAGYLRTAPGTSHPSPWGYRTWAFGALAYSDILALHEDRGAQRHPLPYLQDKLEYPVLMGLGMWWPSVLAPERSGYFALTYLALALCGLGALWFLASLPAASPWTWAASPALLVYGGLNWDLFGILPLALGIWLWAKGRERAAVAVLGLAVWTKFFPLLVLGVLLLVSLRKSVRHALELSGIFLLVSLVLNLPFALFATDNWLWFFRYNRIREIEPSLYLLAGADPRAFVPIANQISAAVTLGAAALLAVLELRTRRLDALRAACGLVCIFFAANKVYSPQYWLWVIALIALASLPAWLATAASAVALADFVVSFSFLHLQSDRVWPQVSWFAHAVFWPMVSLRYATLLACAACSILHALPAKSAEG
ncbi:MAG: hypothetical protein E6J78_11220 [Deltaproteobacteria bacterium]|nr:MAG: hypothetical protein E6J78_11220 [Deltaproteobacteria bacterium]